MSRSRPMASFVLVQQNGESLALLDADTGRAVRHFRVPFKGGTVTRICTRRQVLLR